MQNLIVVGPPGVGKSGAVAGMLQVAAPDRKQITVDNHTSMPVTLPSNGEGEVLILDDCSRDLLASLQSDDLRSFMKKGGRVVLISRDSAEVPPQLLDLLAQFGSRFANLGLGRPDFGVQTMQPGDHDILLSPAARECSSTRKMKNDDKRARAARSRAVSAASKKALREYFGGPGAWRRRISFVLWGAMSWAMWFLILLAFSAYSLVTGLTLGPDHDALLAEAIAWVQSTSASMVTARIVAEVHAVVAWCAEVSFAMGYGYHLFTLVRPAIRRVEQGMAAPV